MRAYVPNQEQEENTILLPGRKLRERSLERHPMVCFLAVISAVILCVSCRPSKPGPDKAEPKTAQQDALAEAVATPPDASTTDSPTQEPFSSDPMAIAVPDGNAEELIQFISNVAQQEPRGNTDEERTQDIARQMEARIVACQKLLEKDGGEHRMLAQQTKLESLRVLVAVGIEGANQRFQDLVDELASSPADDLQRLGRIGLYQARLDTLIAEGPKSPMSPEEVVAALRQLLEQEKLDLAVLQTANETGLLFNKIGLTAESEQVFDLISTTFQDNADPQLAEAAETAAEQAKMMRLGDQIRSFVQADGKQGTDELTSAIRQMKASARLAESLLNVAQNLEYSGKADKAKLLYDLTAEMSSQLDGEQTEYLKESLVRAQTRLGMIGNDFSLSGVKSDGDPFAWEEYAGKVVLVDFWATWCSPCIAEIPNVLENYERFHEAGFEVVGVNMDDDPADARNFLEERKLPWVTVISEDDEARGFQDPNCAKYGVSAIPFLVLVGRDGKVDSLHLRGPLLEKRLAELLPADELATESAEEDVEVSADEPERGERDLKPSDDGESNAEQTEKTLDILDGPMETLPPDAAFQAVLNPYAAADDLESNDLVLYLLELKDKPKSIQRRPGFREAIYDVADRILASSAGEPQKVMAAREKLHFRHQAACLGEDEAQRQLMQTVSELRDTMPVSMTEDFEFFELEARSLCQEQSSESLVPVIQECTNYLEAAATELDARHLRLASNTVELINRLPAESRDAQFERLAQALIKSPTRDVAQYGKTLMVARNAGPAVGDTLDVRGTTVDGQLVELKSFRESVVLVEFWATWCGACRKIQPAMDLLLEKHPDVKLISICLNADQDELDDFLLENHPRGYIVFGEDAQRSAKSMGVRSIPKIFVVDQQSRLQHVARSTDHLSEVIQKLDVKNDG